MKTKVSSYTLIAGILTFLTVFCENKDKTPEQVPDIDGNIYKTILIGDQVWMAENLRTTRYNDGTQIPLINDNEDWRLLTYPGYCFYSNNEGSYKDTYGALYNGYCENTGKLCPAGWHIPAVDEWQQLRDYLGDTLTAGGKLKESGTAHWLNPNMGADNGTGFTALPAGIRYLEGSFSSVSYFTAFWASTENETDKGWYLSLYYGDALATMNQISKKHGFSIRCVKDQ